MSRKAPATAFPAAPVVALISGVAAIFGKKAWDLSDENAYLGSLIVERDALLDNYEARLAQQATELVQKDVQIAQRDGTIRQRDVAIRERDEVIKRLRAGLGPDSKRSG